MRGWPVQLRIAGIMLMALWASIASAQQLTINEGNAVCAEGVPFPISGTAAPGWGLNSPNFAVVGGGGNQTNLFGAAVGMGSTAPV